MHGEKQDFSVRRGLPQLTGDGDAVEAGQGHVENRNVRSMLQRQIQDILAIAGRPADFPAGVGLHDAAHPAANDFVIIRDQNSKHTPPVFL